METEIKFLDRGRATEAWKSNTELGELSTPSEAKHLEGTLLQVANAARNKHNISEEALYANADCTHALWRCGMSGQYFKVLEIVGESFSLTIDYNRHGILDTQLVGNPE